MKSIPKTLVALVCLCGLALGAAGQPAPKVVTVDMAKLYDTHYKTEEQVAKFREDEAKAEREIEAMNTEGNSLVTQYREMIEQSENPALTAEARQKAQADAARKREQIEQKQKEVEDYQTYVRSSLQQRMLSHREVLLEEINGVVTQIAKNRGATLVFDLSGKTLNMLSAVVYADPAYDITTEAQTELNKNRPTPPSAPAAAPAKP